MATFPRTEPDVRALAESLIAGFTANADQFPAPPVNPGDLAALLATFDAARHKANHAAAAAKQATLEKRAALKQLMVGMKRSIRYAESIAFSDQRKLSLIGWGGRRPGERLESPGQVRDLEILHEGPDWIALDWKPPADGGKVAAYKVLRCRRGTEKTESAGTAVECASVLLDQERGVEWQYWVVAINRAGEGRESNTVTAVL
jgi:hypothetical protein